MMRVLAFFLLGIHLTSAATHTLQYFYTATSGIENFPEFMTAGVVDGQQIDYYDSKIRKAVQKAEWMSGAVDPDYWNSNTQIYAGSESWFKNGIEILKPRFNQTGGVHTVQVMYGCEFDDQTGETNGFRQEGYDGEDFLHLDLKEMRYISPVQQGFPTVQKWNNDKGFLESDRNYFSTVCIEWLKKYLEYGKSSLKKTVSPQVSLLQKSSSSPVVCHATGFYPSGVTISWMKNDQEHHEDVEVGELLPNEDGTFQKTSTIKVTPEEWKKNKFSCVVEHQDKTKTAEEIRTNPGESVPICIIVGVLAAVILLVVIGVTGYMVYQKKKGFKPVSGSDDGSNSSPNTDPRNTNDTRHVGDIIKQKILMLFSSCLFKLHINKEKYNTGS